MPVQTNVLSLEPELVEQHVISVALDPSSWAIPHQSPLPATEQVLTVTLLTYGATITHLTCPDKNGHIQDLVLGFDDWQEYIRQAKGLNPHYGATIGRTASRIAHAEFQLDGKTFPLRVSNGKDCLHGGPWGFDKRYWTTHRIDHSRNAVQLRLVDPADANGYPGTLETLVEFRVTDQGDIEIEYEAKLVPDPNCHHDKDDATAAAAVATIVSLTNHTYWNLNGVLNNNTTAATSPISKSSKGDNKEATTLVEGSIRDHTLWLASNTLIRLGSDHPVPTGEILHLPANLQHLPPCLDLAANPDQGTLLGPGIDNIPGGYGYDHVYLLDTPLGATAAAVAATSISASSLKTIGIQAHYPHTPHVATLRAPATTGLALRLLTSEPALVVYAAGYLDAAQQPSTKSTTTTTSSSSSTPTMDAGVTATRRAAQGPFSGLCLEPIRIPDAIHHEDWAPMAILRQGQTYRQKSVFQLRLLT
ncbi:hypothetical protein DFQ27_000954 [Actinomortierella ambigua]|uniref:Aldose 1-epimerase n=1 Tax=Actinomortierella ambigua TaxID=1343610 RepID=A0A9P6QBF6_9FUNG|nr:hypothetical protein DFQ27_000954 [Actinomortierella ambigua]